MRRSPVLPSALLALAAAGPAFAQCTPSATTFCVTMGLRTPGHPNQGGFGEAYYINGVESPVLTLTRGQTYTFRMVNIPFHHPFYICDNAMGGGSGPYITGVSPPSVSGNEAMTWAVAPSAPAQLFYACTFHPFMGWQVNLVDPPGCYGNCDGSTASPVLNVGDFTCFLQRYAAGESYANCDASTAPPVLNVGDFTCFLQRYAAGCP